MAINHMEMQPNRNNNNINNPLNIRKAGLSTQQLNRSDPYLPNI